MISKLSLSLMFLIFLGFLIKVGCTAPATYDDTQTNNEKGLVRIQSEEHFAPANTTFNQDEGKVVFVSHIEGKPEIYLMDGDGGNRQRLTENDIYESSPNWAPNGKQIIFISSTDQYKSLDLMDLEIGSTTQLLGGTEFLDNPIWSPNGEWIILGRSGELFLISPDLSYQMQLTDFDKGVWSAPLAWSADGERILFHSNYEIPGPVVSMAKLYTLNVKDKVIHAIADRQFSYLQSADWSPNGQKIVYTEGLRGTRLFVWNYHDDTNLLLMETQRPDSLPYDWTEVDAKWLPDGQHIIFSMSKFEGNLDIFILDTLTDDLIRLTDDSAHENQPAWWSP